MKNKKKGNLKTIGTLKKLADYALQDHFRRIKTKCELCPNSYQVAHHFIKKSQSNYLRYNEKNLIFICNPCHSKFHSFPDAEMGIRVLKLRGEKWYNYIKENRHKIKRDDRKELETIIKKYATA